MSTDFRLGDWIIRPQRRVIERGASCVHLKPKSMAVLECLMAANGDPVPRNKLFDTVWPGGEISDNTLTRCVAELRKAFGDTARDSRVIETIPKLGFRLVQPVKALEVAPSEDLAAAAPSSLKSQAPGIAVLPFVNASSNAGDDHLSDGISEAILNALANTNRVPVIARTSSFQFKGQTGDIKEIGRLLGVTHVLEGSVQAADKRIRVTTQLIDTLTGTHVWSGVYQREMSDVFMLQNEITMDITDQIGIALGGEFTAPINNQQRSEYMAARHTGNAEAYELYLRGMQMLASTNPGPSAKAVAYFEGAIALDADYADAWAAKGRALQSLGKPNCGHSDIPATVYPKAMAAFRRALQLQPEHAFAMGWLGEALMRNDFKWAEGMQLLRQSVARNPNDAALLSVYAMHMKVMKIAGADEILDRAYRLDPFGMIPITMRALNLVNEGRPLDGLTALETSLIGNRGGYTPNSFAAMFNLMLGRLDAAEEHLQRARLVAHPVDLDLDAMGWEIDSRRGKKPFPLAEFSKRVRTERVSWLAYIGMSYEWGYEQAIAETLDLAVEQRHPELSKYLFGPKPAQLPEADWQRIQEITGAAQFLASR